MKTRTLTAAGFVAVASVSMAAGVWLDSARAASPPSVLTPITPCRLVDTRPGPDHVGARTGALGPNETLTLAVVGRNGDCEIPSDATGISTNVTIVSPSANGFLTVFPAGLTAPKASNLNWLAGQAPTANQVTVGLGAAGISVLNRYGTVDVIVDIVGYYTPGGVGATRVTSPNGEYSLAVTNEGISITSGGVELVKVSGKNVSITADNLNVTSNLTNTFAAGVNTNLSSGAALEVITGSNASITTGNNLSVSTGTNMSVATGNNVTQTIGRDLSINTVGKTTLASASVDAATTGATSLRSGTTMGLTVGSALTVATGTDAAITAGRAFMANATTEGSLTAGSNLTLQSGATTTVRGNQVRVIGQQTIIF